MSSLHVGICLQVKKTFKLSNPEKNERGKMTSNAEKEGAPSRPMETTKYRKGLASHMPEKTTLHIISQILSPQAHTRIVTYEICNL